MASISIITVVKNDKNKIEDTILSVINQNKKNYEYIVIDGNSDDGTKDIIEKYQSNIDLYISEQDSGIYSAMNKSLEYVNNEWVIFLNSGDCLYSDKITSEIDKYLNDNYSMVYGDYYVPETNKYYYSSPVIKNEYRGKPFSHQAVFINIKDLKKNKFDTKFKISADFNQFIKIYQCGREYQKVDLVISTMDRRGLSSNNLKSALDDLRVLKQYPISIADKLYYFKVLVIAVMKTTAKIILGYW